MADNEDRLDRNNRNTTDRSLQIADKLAGVATSVAVISTQLAAVEKRLDGVDYTLRDSLTRYATKDDLKGLTDQISEVKKNISWAVKIVVSAVIITVLGVAFAKGNISVH